MREKDLTASIFVTDKNIKVVFGGGLWTRAMVDAAHRSMLQALPAHISAHKSLIESEKQNKKGE